MWIPRGSRGSESVVAGHRVPAAALPTERVRTRAPPPSRLGGRSGGRMLITSWCSSHADHMHTASDVRPVRVAAIAPKAAGIACSSHRMLITRRSHAHGVGSLRRGILSASRRTPCARSASLRMLMTRTSSHVRMAGADPPPPADDASHLRASLARPGDRASVAGGFGSLVAPGPQGVFRPSASPQSRRKPLRRGAASRRTPPWCGGARCRRNRAESGDAEGRRGGAA